MTEGFLTVRNGSYGGEEAWFFDFWVNSKLEIISMGEIEKQHYCLVWNGERSARKGSG